MAPSVADPDPSPDPNSLFPYVFEPPGSLSGSLSHPDPTIIKQKTLIPAVL
jgi:hypothetical protein